MAIVNFSALWKVVLGIAWVIICIIPFIALIVLTAYVIAKIALAKAGQDTTSSAIKEVLLAKKQRFCKLVEFRK